MDRVVDDFYAAFDSRSARRGQWLQWKGKICGVQPLPECL